MNIMYATRKSTLNAFIFLKYTFLLVQKKEKERVKYNNHLEIVKCYALIHVTYLFFKYKTNLGLVNNN